MISLETLAALEQKVEQAIARIATLTQENTQLKEQCEKYETEISQLRQQLQAFQADQTQLEQGILNALNRLDTVENAVIKTAEASVISESVEVTNDTAGTEVLTSPESSEASTEQIYNSNTEQQAPLEPQVQFDQQQTENNTDSIQDNQSGEDTNYVAPQNGQYDIF